MKTEIFKYIEIFHKKTKQHQHLAVKFQCNILIPEKLI